jgi:hypothetical protein
LDRLWATSQRFWTFWHRWTYFRYFRPHLMVTRMVPSPVAGGAEYVFATALDGHENGAQLRMARKKNKNTQKKERGGSSCAYRH